jgi:hypothetical protein
MDAFGRGTIFLVYQLLATSQGSPTRASRLIGIGK